MRLMDGMARPAAIRRSGTGALAGMGQALWHDVPDACPR